AELEERYFGGVTCLRVAVIPQVDAGRSVVISLIPTSATVAVAVFAPVAPADACRTSLNSMDSTAWPLPLFEKSTRSVIPAGAVHVATEWTMWVVTTRRFAPVVVTDGVACVVALAVVWAFWTSMGVFL